MPETKEQPKQLIASEESTLKMAVPSDWKVMNTVWDCQGIIFIDYLENCKTITGIHYVVRRIEHRQEKIPRLDLHNNTPAHFTTIVFA